MDHRRRSTPRHARRSRRAAGGHRTALVAAAVPLGLLASGLLVWHASYAAFVGTTDNQGSTWTTGDVTISDDDAGSALFAPTASQLVPGDSGVRCIAVSYTGSLQSGPGGVRLFGTATGDTTLASALRLTVEVGSGGGFGSCSGFTTAQTVYDGTLGGFTSGGSPHTDYSTGVGGGSWVPGPSSASSPSTKTYRLTYAFPAGSYDATYQGKTTGMRFTWEAHSLGSPA